MIDREMLGERSVQMALAALFLSVVFAGWELSRAIRLDPVAEGSPLKMASAEALARPDHGTLPDIVSVVALNVFSPERTAPKRRYRLAGYTDTKAAPEPPKPVVLGTALSTGDRSFAVCKVGDGPTTVVRIGNIIGGFTVKSIERGLVVFAAPTGERISISATKP